MGRRGKPEKVTGMSEQDFLAVYESMPPVMQEYVSLTLRVDKAIQSNGKFATEAMALALTHLQEAAERNDSGG